VSTTTPSTGTREATDLPGRFKWLVQSPFRSDLIRYLHSRTSDAFSVEGFMQRFGKLQQDVENCLRELVAFGVARRASGEAVRASQNTVWRSASAARKAAAKAAITPRYEAA